MATRILQEHGLRKLYLGFYPTLIRESIGLGCYFGFYDALIKHFTHDGKVNLLGALFSGAMAGIGFWAFIYPVDYIKTVIQADSLTAPKFKGSWHCATEELKKGHKVFFTGFVIMMCRAMVCNAFGFACF
jgi:solute carrier family 25 carnitine/acylcarnitine transporter 20/29